MVGFIDRLKFGFTAKKRQKTYKKKGYMKGSDGNIYRNTGFGLEKVGVKKSWF